MDASFARRRLIEPRELRLLTGRSNLRGALQMGSHLGAIAVAAWLHAQALGSAWVLLTGFVLGVLVNFLYAAQHELSHSTVFAARASNEWFGRAIGFVQMFPRDFDQIMHFAHHKWTQDWERDGELAREPYTLTSYLLTLSGISYWRNRVAGIVRRACGVIVEPYIQGRDVARVVRESRWHLLGYALVAGVSIYYQSAVAITFWLAPMILTKPVHQLQNLMEHLGLSHRDDTLENTRSTRTNALMRWLCWQMQYHTAHHTYPAVPFWKLRELNERIESVAGEVNRMGYIEFQVEMIRRLAKAGEDHQPMDRAWVVPRSGGRTAALQPET